MTTNKKFKQRVRERMRRTGESYTAARTAQMKDDEAEKIRRAVEVALFPRPAVTGEGGDIDQFVHCGLPRGHGGKCSPGSCT